MKSSSLAAIFATFAIGMASPVAEFVKFLKRNPCDGINATPVLYHEYLGDVCPPINIISSNGDCSGLDPSGNDCASFCQVRTNFVYDTEVPFDNTYCHGPFTCGITETKSVTLTYSTNIGIQDLKALSVGVTGGFSYGTITATARTYSINLPPGSCGYFTFVPVRKDTCGTMTTAPVEWMDMGGIVPVPYCGVSTDIGNYCASEARKNSDGTVDGETIFVKTDCNTREPLPADEQDPVYQNPGVPMDRGVLTTMILSWPEQGPNQSGPDMSSSACVKCTNDLGASSCAAADNQCLINQCTSDSNCQTCGINCTTVS
ncbi:uncharacterized protein LY89DRAFT_733454 [Mollisia scopiformis]|uniref:Uncharacterized protein n=1 Tax=Mollisia scopiformis TaxID=149040 RepID=A0A194XBS4_MOLSC|nr:uncharacterized protein LY89DRAFT_733454 [Mollisia scopiformis]KUJ17615.1 hypothetical protein LY89DRAFT_733454 [Mollisia scopiformis]